MRRMATTQARPGLPPPLFRARSLAEQVRATPPLLLAAALGVAVLYAAFANGAIGIPDETRLQVGIASVSILAIAALLFGRTLGAAARSPAYGGLILLGGFAVWSGISLAWSITPDESWLELNRALAYALVAGLGLVLGASLPRAAQRAALGWLAIATAVSLYALGGKLAPWLNVPGVFDLNPSTGISRLREPIGYWNALALFLVMAVPAGLAAAAELALSEGRGRLLPLAGIAAAASVPAIVLGLTLSDLTSDNVSVHDRTDDGFVLLVALLGGLVAVAALGRVAIRTRALLRLPGGPTLRPVALGAAVVVCVVVVVAAAASGGGGGSQPLNRPSDPSRLLQANASHRLEWWKEALGAASDRPVLGYGAGSFPRLHQLYRKDPVVDVRNAHSVPLEFLAETGVIGAALALGGLALLTVAAVRGVLARPDGYAIALLAAATAFGLHS